MSEIAKLYERVNTLEHSTAEISLRNEELEKAVQKLQTHLHALQRGMKILLSESEPKKKKPEDPPAPKAAIQAL
jgi:FtsZ-binding cell division protein ZapB